MRISSEDPNRAVPGSTAHAEPDALHHKAILPICGKGNTLHSQSVKELRGRLWTPEDGIRSAICKLSSSHLLQKLQFLRRKLNSPAPNCIFFAELLQIRHSPSVLRNTC